MAKILDPAKFIDQINNITERFDKNPNRRFYLKNRRTILKNRRTNGIGFWLRASDPSDWLTPTSDKIINFNLYQDNGYSKIINYKNKNWLAHNGYFSPTRKFNSVGEGFKTIEINGKNYFLVSRLDDDQFIENLVKYHESRLPISSKAASSTLYKGKNGGSRGPYRVESSDRDPKHSSVVEALASSLPSKWLLVDENMIQPDLFITDGSIKILFEAKPSYDFSNLCHAVGQLIYYSQFVRPHKMVYVAFGLPQKPLADHEELLLKYNIHFLEAKSINGGKNYTFPQLSHILGK